MASGKTVVFVQRAGGGLPSWSHDPTIEPRATTLTMQHALASASIPVLFRPVPLDGEFHCDGGLRQNVPLSPARRLGADGLVVVNPRRIELPQRIEAPVHEPIPGPFSLLGKTLNALLLDRIDTDVARLEGITRFLEAGTRRYGPGFNDAITEALGNSGGDGGGRAIRPLKTILVRTSGDIGKMSVDFVRSPRFEARVKGPLARVMRRLADGEGAESDLLSYLLFDGEFSDGLIELGRADAAARHEELCAFFEELTEPAAASRGT